ncbi:uncharacterized protein LOC121869192 [Homarus americanus]|uniref:uncharacterized protein LOC121869192 n=1 Tax=Homarus americanus TaxID=6706 RepID=UPI001C47785B|nr:uncharacterized protein LOC121869192 [Homarus americanus]
MAEQSGDEGAQQFFPIQEWEKLPPIEKKRCENLYKNHIFLKNMGLKSKPPDFTALQNQQQQASHRKRKKFHAPYRRHLNNSDDDDEDWTPESECNSTTTRSGRSLKYRYVAPQKTQEKGRILPTKLTETDPKPVVKMDHIKQLGEVLMEAHSDDSPLSSSQGDVINFWRTAILEQFQRYSVKVVPTGYCRAEAMSSDIPSIMKEDGKESSLNTKRKSVDMSPCVVKIPKENSLATGKNTFNTTLSSSRFTDIKNTANTVGDQGDVECTAVHHKHSAGTILLPNNLPVVTGSIHNPHTHVKAEPYLYTSTDKEELQKSENDVCGSNEMVQDSLHESFCKTKSRDSGCTFSVDSGECDQAQESGTSQSNFECFETCDTAKNATNHSGSVNKHFITTDNSPSQPLSINYTSEQLLPVKNDYTCSVAGENQENTYIKSTSQSLCVDDDVGDENNIVKNSTNCTTIISDSQNALMSENNASVGNNDSLYQKIHDNNGVSHSSFVFDDQYNRQSDLTNGANCLMPIYENAFDQQIAVKANNINLVNDDLYNEGQLSSKVIRPDNRHLTDLFCYSDSVSPEDISCQQSQLTLQNSHLPPQLEGEPKIPGNFSPNGKADAVQLSPRINSEALDNILNDPNTKLFLPSLLEDSCDSVVFSECSMLDLPNSEQKTNNCDGELCKKDICNLIPNVSDNCESAPPNMKNTNDLASTDSNSTSSSINSFNSGMADLNCTPSVLPLEYEVSLKTTKNEMVNTTLNCIGNSQEKGNDLAMAVPTTSPEKNVDSLVKEKTSFKQLRIKECLGINDQSEQPEKNMLSGLHPQKGCNCVIIQSTKEEVATTCDIAKSELRETTKEISSKSRGHIHIRSSPTVRNIRRKSLQANKENLNPLSTDKHTVEFVELTAAQKVNSSRNHMMQSWRNPEKNCGVLSNKSPQLSSPKTDCNEKFKTQVYPFRDISSAFQQNAPVTQSRCLVSSVECQESSYSNTESVTDHSSPKQNPVRRNPRRVRGTEHYVEEKIPDEDEYLYCEDCDQEWEGECLIHPLTLILDNPVVRDGSVKNRARLTPLASEYMSI